MGETNIIIERLAAYRIRKGISQSKLATEMGFKDRQTLSAVENYERALQPSELMAALQFMGLSMDMFLDPLSLVGKARFSWRQQEASNEDLDATESYASRVIALFEHLSEEETEHSDVLMFKLPLTKKSTASDAANCAESLAQLFELGDYPAFKLQDVVPSKLGIRALYLDLDPKVSAAAVNITKKNYIVVNRNEVFGRLNFNYAHELFHCLTWDALPPNHCEKAYSTAKGKKPTEEKLADAFASALLMPAVSIEKHLAEHPGEITEDFINALANKYGVSSVAMLVRLETLGKLTRSQANAMDKKALRFNGDSEQRPAPLLYNREFVTTLHNALGEGRISVRKAACDLNTTFEDLRDVFASYNLSQVFDL